MQRLASWAQLTAGMFYAITAHRAFCASVLSFVAQLEQPSTDTIRAYNRSLSKVAKGPGNWIQHKDLFHLEQLGFPKAVVSLEWLALATRVRVWFCENWDKEDNCDPQELAAAITEALPGSTIEKWQKEAPYLAEWALTSYASHALRIKSDLADKGINIEEWVRTHNSGYKKDHQAKKAFQKELYKEIANKDDWSAINRIRQKTLRWQHTGIPRLDAERTLTNLTEIGRKAPPCVTSACIGTVCNRWVTERRMQKRESAENCCAFGCNKHITGDSTRQPEDSIEHYWHCDVVKEIFGPRLARLQSHTTKDLLLLCAKLDPSERIVTSAAVFAAYATYNHIKHNNTNTPPTREFSLQFAKQKMRELAGGSSPYAKTLYRLVFDWQISRPAPP